MSQDLEVFQVLRNGNFLDRVCHTEFVCRQNKNILKRDLYTGVWVNYRENEVDPCPAADNDPEDLTRRLSYTRKTGAKRVLDFGCGTGSFADALGCDGIDQGDKWPDKEYDLITMWHVLEHLPNPVSTLKALAEKYSCRFLVEVPAAFDPLITTYRPPRFMQRAFHPEHYVLHTRQSLWWTLHCSYLRVCRMGEIPRYNVDNHVGWGAETMHYPDCDTLVAWTI